LECQQRVETEELLGRVHRIKKRSTCLNDHVTHTHCYCKPLSQFTASFEILRYMLSYYTLC